jgi:hypothetical protein
VALVVLALAGGGEVALAVGVRLAALALLALVAALVLGWTSLVPVSLLLLGATYVARLTADDAALDAKAPLFGVGLLLAAELAYWSLEEQQRVRSEPGDGLRRLGFVALLALLALSVGAILLGAADTARAGGLAVDLLGAAAAAAVLLVVVLYARRPLR